jgi:hypothetical protein
MATTQRASPSTASVTDSGGLPWTATVGVTVTTSSGSPVTARSSSVLSFDTSGIAAGATILSATVRVRRETVRGNDPFVMHGAARVDIRTGAVGATAALEPGDFQAPRPRSVSPC